MKHKNTNTVETGSKRPKINSYKC